MVSENDKTPLHRTEKELLRELREGLIRMGEICQSLNTLAPASLKYLPKCRRIKISALEKERLKNPFHKTPSLKLSGEWLNLTGFKPDNYVQVISLNNIMIICPEDLLL